MKVDNFRRSDAKVAYLYVVTPRGLQEKIKAAGAFLERKRAEYDAAEREIRRLTIEMAEFAPEWKTRP